MSSLGLCECGCGEPTAIAQKTNRRDGDVAGQPRRFRPYHHNLKSREPYRVDPETGCWVWLRSLKREGYGQIKYDGKITVAHRVYYELHVGLILEGMEIDHICRNRPCVNPAHLRLATSGENKQNTVGRRGLRGIALNRPSGKWVARCKLGGKTYCLGTFDTEEEAGAVASAWRAEHMPFSPDALAARGASIDSGPLRRVSA